MGWLISWKFKETAETLRAKKCKEDGLQNMRINSAQTIMKTLGRRQEKRPQLEAERTKWGYQLRNVVWERQNLHFQFRLLN